MDDNEVAVGKIYLNKDGVTFRYIYDNETNTKSWIYVQSHNLGKKHHCTKYADCNYCHWQRKHMFKKDVIREATEEEYAKLADLVALFKKDVEDNYKSEKQLMLESYSKEELINELERRKTAV